MSVKRTIRTVLYGEDLPLILETLQKRGCDYRSNSRIAGLRRTFEIAVRVNGKYCIGIHRKRKGAESHFEMVCDSASLTAGAFRKWKGEFEAQVKALQIEKQLARNGYILTGFQEDNERIVLRIKQAV